ncbi:uncharacterized protein LOC135699241 [Ochlerotatus camptorhynchus]|uniref:uncharacterized protein LOC135699241 n=1 Tax=Ochlerotatus camptorhynchus TaxID=644619 RepID=UPI0031D1F0B6
MALDSETASTDAAPLKAVLDNQKRILENQAKQLQSMARLQTTMDYVMELLTNDDQPHKAVGLTEHATENVVSPVSCLDELNALETLLGEEKRMQQFLTGMTFICANNGKAHGMDCCYKLIDYFFTRQFLTQCSWTGAARLTNSNAERRDGEPSMSNDAGGKGSLKCFKKVRKLFLNLILRADRDFSEVNCENFFKTVLKNSKQITISKCQNSKHKNRPKNLKYKSSKQNDENQANHNFTIEGEHVEEEEN